MCVCVNLRRKHDFGDVLINNQILHFVFQSDSFLPSLILQIFIELLLYTLLLFLFSLLRWAFVFFCFFARDFCDQGNWGNNEMITEPWG